MASAAACELCGNALDLHNRHWRFAKPDPVFDAGEIAPADMWMSGEDANTSVLMQVNHIGAFVRALLPVHLTAGHTLTYGVWVAIDPNELRDVFNIWWSEAYEDLVLDGLLANAIEPWGLLGKPVRLRVLDPEHTPYCADSVDGQLRSVLEDEWDHGLVLTAFP